MPAAYGPLAPPFDGVRRVAVLRSGALGDLVFALPAVRALAAAYPDAEVVLLGAPVAAALLAGRAGTGVTRVEVVPAAPGVRPGESDPDEVAAFLERMREQRFDLAVQAHGGGRNSNPFVLALGARHTVGTATADAAPLERTLPYVYHQHEVTRWIEVAQQAGAPAVDLEPVLPVSAEELAAGRALLGPGRHVLVHAGATDPRRWWPAERFGAVAAALADDGATVSVIGDASEAALADRVVAAAGRAGVRSLAGALDLPALVGALATADLVVANDSGPRHLAQAVGAPTVGLFWFGNAINAMPQSRLEHRVQLGWVTHCPVCGVDLTQPGWKTERCEHDPSLLADVPVEAVLADARSLLAGPPRAD